MSERPSPARVLVLGIGNPDRGDDGIGVEVATKLDGRLPVGVRLLACRGDVLSLVDEVSACEALVCADAAAPMGEPGRIHRLDLAAGDLPRDLAVTSSHAFGLAELIGLCRTLGLAPPDIVVYAIEASRFDDGAPVTPAVAGAAAEVADRIVADVERLRQRAAA